MDPTTVITLLNAHRARLSARGVRRLSLFGSAARGESQDSSDIDLAFVPGETFSRGGFDYFAKVDELRSELSAIVHRPVDLVDELAVKPAMKAQIDRDRVIAFE
ncbi:MAG: nucleotidyltransferase domain-containing protein [Rhizobiaceae bacterium]|nr:nucleotidyltransferase domain-containing protein [Rhizobiaceae bacterium]MCV0406567.1 nucleotidyltransferase domain-containing protein [Rhizobiaceae bacterium]